MPQRNLAVELLQKLLKGELSTRRRKNVVQARSFAEMLEQTIRRHQNRAIEAAQVIEELIQLARQMREANARGEVLGDETLRRIARELVETVRNMDPARERACPAPGSGKAHPVAARVSPRQAGKGDADGPGASGTSLGRVGHAMKRASKYVIGIFRWLEQRVGGQLF